MDGPLRVIIVARYSPPRSNNLPGLNLTTNKDTNLIFVSLWLRNRQYRAGRCSARNISLTGLRDPTETRHARQESRISRRCDGIPSSSALTGKSAQLASEVKHPVRV